jgi:transketolase
MRQTCLNTVYELAKKNKKIIFIGSDLGPGVLDSFKKKYPDRFFMEGVAEQSIIGLAAGMAFENFRPYVNTIATFITRRCFEQVVVDLCLHNLPVTLIGNGGGLVYAPLGPTHQAIEDISIMRSIPNLTIISPSDAHEMKNLMLDSVNLKGPLYVRIARGGEEIITQKFKSKIGKAIKLKKAKNYYFLTTGITNHIALEACKFLKKSENIDCGVAHFSTIKPLDKTFLNKIIINSKKIITVEENVKAGGFGSSILEFSSELSSTRKKADIKIMGLKDKFLEKYGTQEELLDYSGLSFKDLSKNMKNFIKK